MKGSAYEKRREQAASEAEPFDGYMPCLFCGKQTLKSILSEHGARCIRCYDAYCAADDGLHQHRGMVKQ